MCQIHSLAEARQKKARIVEQEQFEAALTRVPERDRRLIYSLVDEYGFAVVTRVIESEYGRALNSLR